MSQSDDGDAEWFDRLVEDHPARALTPDELVRFDREAKRRQAFPNLERVPGDLDDVAAELLDALPDVVDVEHLERLTRDEVLALGRLGTRSPSLALRSGSTSILAIGLLSTAVGRAASPTDPRDVMVGLALYVDAAHRLGMDSHALFDATARRLGSHPISGLLRTFGARQDVTLETFGWKLVEPTDGPDYLPA